MEDQNVTKTRSANGGGAGGPRLSLVQARSASIESRIRIPDVLLYPELRRTSPVLWKHESTLDDPNRGSLVKNGSEGARESFTTHGSVQGEETAGRHHP